MVAPEVITENGIFILGYSFEEIRYSQRVKIIFPDFFLRRRVRWKECLETVPFHQSPGTCRRTALAVLSPAPPHPTSHTYFPRKAGAIWLVDSVSSFAWPLVCVLWGDCWAPRQRGRAGKYSGKGSRKTSARSSKSLIWKGAPLFCIKCFAVNF